MRSVIEKLDYTTRDYEGFRQLMLNKLTELMPEYTDHRQSDAGIVILELNAMCLDILSYYLDSIANECFLVTAEQRSNIMKFCKMLGYTPRFATSARYKQIFIKADPNSDITIPLHTKVKTYSSNPENSIYFTTLDSLNIPSGAVGNETDENGEYIYAVEVIHGLFVNNELLEDNAHGQPNQRYALKYAPALIDDNYFSVYVEDTSLGEGSQRWSRVNTFAGSNSSSKVFMIENNDYNETSVLFGDGSFGIAPNNATITCSYVVGGGSVGNVGLGAISELEDNIAGVKSTVNVSVIAEGYEAESLDEIKLNAPISHRNIWGALTVKDYAGVVKVNFPEVVDSEAKKAGMDDWSVPEVDDIEIYMLTSLEISYAKDNNLHTIPNTWYGNNTNYQTLMNQITAFFDSDTDYVQIGSNTVLDGARKLAGTRDIVLHHPNFAKINLKYSLIVRDYFDKDEVSEKIDSYLYNYFQIGHIRFGEEISLQSLMYDIVDKSGIEGIRYLNITLANINAEQGEYDGEEYSVVNNDLLIPKIGSIFVLDSITKEFPDTSLRSRR